MNNKSNFGYFQINQESTDDSSGICTPCLRLKLNQGFPKFSNKRYEIAWIKHILDERGVLEYSRLCGKCLRTLTDGEHKCSNCGTKVQSLYSSDQMTILFTNGREVRETTLHKNMYDNEDSYIAMVNHIARYYPSEYPILIAFKGGIMRDYPTRRSFPDLEDRSTNMYQCDIFIEETSKKCFILDYKFIYEEPENMIIELGLYRAEVGITEYHGIFPEDLGYIELEPWNINFILERMSTIYDEPF